MSPDGYAVDAFHAMTFSRVNGQWIGDVDDVRIFEVDGAICCIGGFPDQVEFVQAWFFQIRDTSKGRKFFWIRPEFSAKRASSYSKPTSE